MNSYQNKNSSNIHIGLYFHERFEGPSFLMIDELLLMKTNPFFYSGYSLSLPEKEEKKIEKIAKKKHTNYFLLKIEGYLDFSNSSPYNNIVGTIKVQKILNIVPLAKKDVLKLGKLQLSSNEVKKVERNIKYIFDFLH